MYFNESILPIYMQVYTHYQILKMALSHKYKRSLKHYLVQTVIHIMTKIKPSVPCAIINILQNFHQNLSMSYFANTALLPIIARYQLSPQVNEMFITKPFVVDFFYLLWKQFLPRYTKFGGGFFLPRYAYFNFTRYPVIGTRQ